MFLVKLPQAVAEIVFVDADEFHDVSNKPGQYNLDVAYVVSNDYETTTKTAGTVVVFDVQEVGSFWHTPEDWDTYMVAAAPDKDC